MPQSEGKNYNLQRQSTRQTLPLAEGRDVYEELRRYSREPFTELLSEWLKCAPDIEDVKMFAKRSPDKYVQALHHLSSLAGFSEKRESTLNVNLNVREMSDSQLEDQLLEIHKQLELEATEVAEAAMDDSESSS